ncbi:MAG: LLM class flavin-dependent oxidoreductase [Halioglobus sp.]|nr:LLM class flavin-dependent oxidoreductase [Halioglobus sp.]
MPIELGTTPWSWRGAMRAEALCAQAEQAEAMGFDAFWLPENHFGAGRSIPSPMLSLAAVAARTRHLRLGCTSYLLPIRHPLQAAEEVAVLDQLSGGRVILGVGRGVQAAMFSAFGVEPADKRKLFARNLEIMRRALRGEPVVEDEHGKALCLSPLPVQQPSPPIWVAAFGPLALRQAAGLGLPYLASPVESLQVLEDNYRLFHHEVAAAGLPPVSVIPVMRTVFVTADQAQADRARNALADSVPPPMRDKAAGVEDWALVGDAQCVRDKLDEYVARLGVTHLVLRGGLPGVSDAQQVASHEQVRALVGG